MDKFIITGGIPLKGEIAVAGAKNVALKILVASLLTDEEMVIDNVPLIRDVTLMLEVLSALGVMNRRDGHTIHVTHNHIHNAKVPLDVAVRLRTSSMVLGPLLARYGVATTPNPGGCRLGARPIDRHISALKDMGADNPISFGRRIFLCKNKRTSRGHHTVSKKYTYRNGNASFGGSPCQGSDCS